jgi:Fcf2 pre-rRNA processing
MTATAVTDAVRYDLAVIRNRNVLDPKRFYKKGDAKKWKTANSNSSAAASSVMLQVGTVIEGATEYYSSRLTQQQRRTNVTDEVLASGDAAYAQSKYQRLQRDRTALAAAQKLQTKSKSRQRQKHTTKR